MKSFKYFVEKVIGTGSKSLGVERDDMPQIKDPEKFVSFLKRNGLKVSEDHIKASDIKFTQKHLKTEKIDDILKQKGEINCSDFLVSSDNHILDGHHRLAAQKRKDENRVICVQKVNAKMPVVLKFANDFSGAKFVGVDEVIDLKKGSEQDAIKRAIDDFKDSDAPQFKGKSKEKRIQMAVAAVKAVRRRNG